jgi:hypothetical protein
MANPGSATIATMARCSAASYRPVVSGADVDRTLSISRWFGGATRCVVAGFLAFAPFACGEDKSLEESMADFEAESGLVFEDCGDYSRCGMCDLDVDESLDTACPPIACLRDAWEACRPAKLDRHVNNSVQDYDERYYVVPRREGGCGVVPFSHRHRGELCQGDFFCDYAVESKAMWHCDGLRFSPPPCLEVSSCSEPTPL